MAYELLGLLKANFMNYLILLIFLINLLLFFLIKNNKSLNSIDSGFLKAYYLWFAAAILIILSYITLIYRDTFIEDLFIIIHNTLLLLSGLLVLISLLVLKDKFVDNSIIKLKW